MSLGTGEPPSSQVWAGPLCLLGPDWDGPSPGLLPRFPSPTCAPPPASFEFFLSCVFFCFPFFPPFLVSGSVRISVGVSISAALPPISSSLGLTGSSSRRLPRFLPSWGPLPSPPGYIQPPPPPRRPLPEPAAAVVGSRDAAGRLELKFQVKEPGGGWRGHPMCWHSGMWAGPGPTGLGKEVARPQTETAGYICPAHNPHPQRATPRTLAENQPNPGRHRPLRTQTQTSPRPLKSTAAHTGSSHGRGSSPAAQGLP